MSLTVESAKCFALPSKRTLPNEYSSEVDSLNFTEGCRSSALNLCPGGAPAPPGQVAICETLLNKRSGFTAAS